MLGCYFAKNGNFIFNILYLAANLLQMVISYLSYYTRLFCFVQNGSYFFKNISFTFK